MMKKFLFCALLIIVATLAGAKETQYGDLNAAIRQAGQEGKALFIIYGRPECENCHALHDLIGRKEVVIPGSFLVADVNCDIEQQRKIFRGRYKVKGDILPFVVIAKPDGTQISSHTGAGTAAEYNELLLKAEKELKVAK